MPVCRNGDRFTVQRNTAARVCLSKYQVTLDYVTVKLNSLQVATENKQD
jgi:hypothetical protein